MNIFRCMCDACYLLLGILPALEEAYEPAVRVEKVTTEEEVI